MIPYAISIVGPTASGKSAFALALASRDAHHVLVNADSQQVYRGMMIGTGSPSAEDQKTVPHFLYNQRDPSKRYDVGLYLQDVEVVLGNLKPDVIPIFVGGTGFYHRALWQGLPHLPRDESVRQLLAAEWKAGGPEGLYRELLDKDEVASRSIHPHNKVRLLRALEVIRITGEPFSCYKDTAVPIPSLRGTRWHKMGLECERRDLYVRIDVRVQKMIEAGLIDEVGELFARFGHAWALERSVGYKEVIAYLEGKMDLNSCIALIQKNTRHYAKRQLTWFRGEKDILWERV